MYECLLSAGNCPLEAFSVYDALDDGFELALLNAFEDGFEASHRDQTGCEQMGLLREEYGEVREVAEKLSGLGYRLMKWPRIFHTEERQANGMRAGSMLLTPTWCVLVDLHDLAEVMPGEQKGRMPRLHLLLLDALKAREHVEEIARRHIVRLFSLFLST